MSKDSRLKADSSGSIFLGTYEFCWINFDVYAQAGHAGGDVFGRPDDKSRPRINIGLNHSSWWGVVGWVMHEAMEWSLDNERARYIHAGEHASGSDQYIFSFDHNQFSEAVARVAYLLTPLLPVLSDAYRYFGPNSKYAAEKCGK